MERYETFGGRGTKSVTQQRVLKLTNQRENVIIKTKTQMRGAQRTIFGNEFRRKG